MRQSIRQAANSLIRYHFETGFIQHPLDGTIRRIMLRHEEARGHGEYPNQHDLLRHYLDSGRAEAHAQALGKSYRIGRDRALPIVIEVFIGIVTQTKLEVRITDTQLRDLSIERYGKDPGPLDETTRERLMRRFSVRLLAPHPITKKRGPFVSRLTHAAPVYLS